MSSRLLFQDIAGLTPMAGRIAVIERLQRASAFTFACVENGAAIIPRRREMGSLHDQHAMKTMKTFSKIVRVTLSIWLAMLFSLATGQSPSNTKAPGPVPIEYSTMQFISSDDSSAAIAEKAAKVLPRPNQTAWMRLERTFFVHFGPNTFRGVEWGTGREDPSVFNPTELDADQWVRAIKESGGKMVVLVCKHHDGFNLWPTRYSNHSVASSPWHGGKGSVVREVADAARKYGVELGVYLSPADLYQLRTNPTNPNGYYGNESEKLRSVIPTDPASFKTSPSNGREPVPGFKSFTYQVDDYNRYFLNELYELLTEYGPIREVWFDGANPDPSVHEDYDYAAWYDLIRKLQPQATIFGKGPDARWVGNESGIGRTTEWSVVPLSSSPDTFRWPDMTAQDLGSLSKLTPSSYLWWYPAEVNEPILYGWFWHPKKHVRSAADLIDIYYTSVGRNGNMLLNLSPDTRGLIPDNQLAQLRLMAQVVDETFAKDLAAGGKLTADNSNQANSALLALDGNLDTWWEAAPGQKTATLTLKLPKAATFDVVSLQEAVDHRGQRIESFSVDVWDGATWKTMDEQTTVGHKRLLRWSSPVTTDQVRIRITGSRLEPTLAEVRLFKQAELVHPPVISERDVNGLVTIGSGKGLPVVYTLDGTVPTLRSPVYRSAIALPRGGEVYAACLAPDGRLGMVTSKYFAGLAPIGWKVVSEDSQETNRPASNAIDGNPATIWQSRLDADKSLPHQLTVDMGSVQRIAGFTYLPRQDGSHDGVVENYRFETSVDGHDWITNVDSGRFGNIQNNPELQEVQFAPVRARFFRFTALKEIGTNGWTSAAEISVLPAEDEAGR
jgi:alpha-L-fucosidase